MRERLRLILSPQPLLCCCRSSVSLACPHLPWHGPTKKKEVEKNPSTKMTWWCFSWSPNSTRRAYGVFSLEHVLELNPLATWFGNSVPYISDQEGTYTRAGCTRRSPPTPLRGHNLHACPLRANERDQLAHAHPASTDCHSYLRSSLTTITATHATHARTRNTLSGTQTHTRARHARTHAHRA